MSTGGDEKSQDTHQKYSNSYIQIHAILSRQWIRDQQLGYIPIYTSFLGLSPISKPLLELIPDGHPNHFQSLYPNISQY
jgi:hypothetical protein